MAPTAGRRAPRRRLLAAAAVAVIAALVAALAPTAGARTTTGTPDAVSVVVHLDRVVGDAGAHLLGVGWNTGASLEAVAPLAPPTVRIDGRLQDLPADWTPADLADLLARVAEVRRIGAEPQVILSYLPDWIEVPVDLADLDRWEALVEGVVEVLATADAPARRFEVWNEPELPVFWPDTPAAFLELAVRSHRAVAAVEARHAGLELEIGGPASVAPLPQLLVPYVARIAGEGLPLDYVSWHYYGNYPFLGPDGNEGLMPDELHRLAGRRNPVATPRSYGLQIPMVRSWVDAAVAGTGLDPDLVIDEWNLSAGGYDRRHDTNEGAAFAAAVLTEMERAGLDGADFYRATGSAVPGDWGMTTADGDTKPVWWVFDAWRGAGPHRLAVDGDQPETGLWARATADPATGAVEVLLSAFLAEGGSGRAVSLELAGAVGPAGGCPASTATVATLDADHAALDRPVTVPVAGGTIPLALPDQSVTVVTLDC